MPYIEQTARKDIARGMGPKNAGDLNYVFTNTLLEHSRHSVAELHELFLATMIHYMQPKVPDNYRYQDINDVGGAVLNSIAEHARRRGDLPEYVIDALMDAYGDFYDLYATPYEEKKIVANGDIPGYHGYIPEGNL